MMRRHVTLWVLGLLLCCGAVQAQMQELLSVQKLSPAEALELRELLAQEPQEGLSGKALVDWFQRKDAAAFRLGEPAERERVLRQWLKAAPSIDSKWTLGSFLMDNSASTAEGFALMEEVLQEEKHPVHMVRVRSRLALGFIEEHQLKKTQALLDEAEVILKRDFARFRNGAIGYWAVRAEIEFYRSKARLLWRQGRFDEALDTARRSANKGGDLKALENFAVPRQVVYGRSWHAGAAVEVAVILTRMGRLFDAEEALREAKAIYRDYQFTEDQMVFFYRWVADLYFAQSRYADSLKIANNVRAVQQRQGLSDGTAQSIFTRMRINSALIAQEKWTDAAKEFESIDQAVGDNPRLKPIARMVDMRAITYMNTGRLEEATRLLKGTLDWSTNNLGADHYFTSFKRGLYAVALSQDPTQQGPALREFERAIRGITAPETLPANFEETPFRMGLKKLIFKSYVRLLAQTPNASGQEAAQAFMVSNHLISSFVQQAIGDAAARAAIKQPGLGEIARQDQDAKAELLTLYAYISEQSNGGEDKRNPEVVKAMRARMLELEGQRRGFKAQIQTLYPEYFQLLQPKAPSPAEIAALLGPKEVFITLVPLEAETFVFGINREGQVIFHRSELKQAQVADLVKKVRSTLDVAELGPKAPRFQFAEAYTLYQQLIQPLEGMLQGKDHLIVASSGALGQLPLAVLPRQPWPSGSHAEAPWLAKDFAVSHISSANAWASLKRLSRTPSGQAPLMAWGDPRFAATMASADTKSAQVRSVLNTRALRSSDLDMPAVDLVRYAELPPLPETRDEVLALAKVLKANPQSDVFLGDRATRQSVLKASQDALLADTQIVVFATHGLLPGDLPRLSQPALAMASTKDVNDSPLLTLEDVLSLRLNADWVVLSACNTAGADGQVEEALSGLARGFFYAGSRSLLVTHWSVESESAMLLTTQTFEAYKGKAEMTRSQALRQAMLYVMQKPQYAHPTFWAPYALVGEGGR